MQRLGKNIGGYKGEPIDIQAVLRGMEAAIEGKNWMQDRIRLFSNDGSNAINFIALRRPSASARKRVYLSTGIHGDEPAGPLAMLQLLREDLWPADAALWICPCLNLTGFPLNRRENADGIDLNRDYRHFKTLEVRAHVDWLHRQPAFDIALCLHEDWEAQGFYMYELNMDKRASFAGKILARVAEVCPIDTSPVIEKWPAQNGVIRPPFIPADRPQWPESLYLIMNKTRLSFTMEAPSDFALAVRIAALKTAVREVLALI
jgi:murein peptide amidase A